MSNRKVYRLMLTREEREALTQVAKGNRGQLKIAVWKVQRANAMLMCDESEYGPAWSDENIAEAFGTTTRSLENWRKQAALQGPLSLLERKGRDTPPTAPILDGDKEARLTKIACSTPPNGRSRWTLQMLADELVSLEVVESISVDTVGRVQKNEMKPWLKSMWCILPEQDAAFVAAMEEALTMYHRPYDPLFPWSIWTSNHSSSYGTRVPHFRCVLTPLRK